MMKRASVVYVHLGQNPAPTLIPFSRLVNSQLSDVDLYLITDFPTNWKEFPGTIIEYNKKLRTKEFDTYAKKFRVFEKISGGYWIFTLERLFAIHILSQYTDGPIIHLESDVYPIFSSELIDILHRKVHRVAVPRYSESRGIASFLYAKSFKDYLEILEQLLYILNTSTKSILEDMDLLGVALNKKILEELPTYPSDSWEVNFNGEFRHIIFDAAALGQYLFGQDPFHTDGFRISGYKNPDFKIDLSNYTWNLAKDITRHTSLNFEASGKMFYPVNLHIHSKELLPPLDLNNARWVRAIEEGNGQIERLRSAKVLNTIHSKPIEFSTRLRLAKRTGMIKAFMRVFRRIKGV
jgi:hypothetical protein